MYPGPANDKTGQENGEKTHFHVGEAGGRLEARGLAAARGGHARPAGGAGGTLAAGPR